MPHIEATRGFVVIKQLCRVLLFTAVFFIVGTLFRTSRHYASYCPHLGGCYFKQVKRATSLHILQKQAEEFV